MRTAVIEKGVPGLVALLGATLLTLWIASYIRTPLLPERPLGHEHMHGMAAAGPPATSPIPSTEYRVASSGAGMPGMSAAAGPAPAPAPSAVSTAVPPTSGLWPGFRGPNRDDVAPDASGLSTDWAARPPKVLWSANVGEGYAGPAVRNSRVYLLDYDQAGQADTLRCFALADGRELWRQAYPVVVKRNHGMSRTVPAVTEKYVVTLGPKCHVMCCDALTGERKWFIDLVAQLGATVPEWYAGQCPLIDGSKVILAPGGTALMMAVDLATGKVLWQTPNPRAWTMTHGSIMPVTAGGKRMYVYCASKGVVGVSAADGKLLWENPDWTIETATVPSPLDLGGGRIFLTGGYHTGSMLLQIEAQGAGFAGRTVKKIDEAVFGSDQHTPVLYKDHIFGITSGGQMVCLDRDGNRVWASGTENRFGLGPFLLAGGMIYALSDSGTLTLAEATPAGFQPKGKFAALDGQDAWAPMALAGSRLLLRDLTRMVCLDIGRQ